METEAPVPPPVLQLYRYVFVCAINGELGVTGSL